MSSTRWTDRTVGEIVGEDYGRASVFRKFGIDFCCGGGKPLAEACRSAGVEPRKIEEALDAHHCRRWAQEGLAAPEDPAPAEPGALADYIESVHHAWVRENLPALLHFTERVAQVHGDKSPELRTIAARTRELALEMEEHMQEEEETLFPMARSRAPTDGEPFLSDGILEELKDEHERAADLTREIRSLTHDYTPPPQACPTWKAAYAKLQEFEVDLHRHVHLENNVLFPMLTGG